MAEAGRRESLRTVWQRLSTAYEWKLLTASQIEQLFDRAENIILELDFPTGNMRKLAEEGIRRAYSEQLYRALLDRKQQAAAELWQIFRRLGLRYFSNEQTAEEIAQEGVLRVLRNLYMLQNPQSLFSWAFRIFYSLRKERLVQQKNEDSNTSHAHEAQEERSLEVEYADPIDLIERIDQLQIDNQLLDALDKTLTNKLERYVILRIVALGDAPREVARDLNLPLHRTRLAKSRALKRLRENTAFMHLLREITGLAEFTQGVSYDASETE